VTDDQVFESRLRSAQAALKLADRKATEARRQRDSLALRAMSPEPDGWGWTQQQVAQVLGVSRQTAAQFARAELRRVRESGSPESEGHTP
jgi:multidrug resistance efflux pump